MNENNKCNPLKKFDWKFWVLIITVILSTYKAQILSASNVHTLSNNMKELRSEVVSMRKVLNKYCILVERVDERTKNLLK